MRWPPRGIDGSTVGTGGSRASSLQKGLKPRMPDRSDIVLWVGRHILPLEGEVRRWLRKAAVAPADVDDVIQEAYCRIAGLDAVSHIKEPRAYFFQVVRNILLEQVRRAR